MQVKDSKDLTFYYLKTWVKFHPKIN